MPQDEPNSNGPDPGDSHVFYGGGGGQSESLPEAIGPYRILRKLGQGGMGVVYHAEQHEPIRRDVALKLIRLGMDSEQIVGRFHAERQSMAVMDHPGIARVFDAGATELGRPYFVMEYVRGEPITTYCDEHRLDARSRLGLFIEICRAVQHAHQKGVIHRDLKPSNVLVTESDDGPRPKVIDFGIARATTPELAPGTLFTQAGQFVGTPEYMSPEQLDEGGMDIDTRADVYSLGVMLYELLVGAAPLDLRVDAHQSVERMRHRIREEDPPRPSTRVTMLGDESTTVAARRRSDPDALRVLLKGDLDWIVMKAMDKDRSRRYDSASEFADDIERFLRAEPVRAAPPSAPYLVRKFVSRHRGAVAAVSAVLFVLIAGLVLSIGLYVQAESARRNASAQAARVEEVNRFLTDMLRAADPSEDGRDVRVVDLLSDAAERAAGEFADRPVLRATIQDTIAATYAGLGQYDAARTMYEDALVVYEQRLGRDDPVTIGALAGLGSTLYDLGLVEESEATLRDALARCGSGPGTVSESSVRALNSLAVVLIARGDHEEAESLLIRCRETAGELGPDFERTGMTALQNLAQLKTEQRRFEEAEADLQIVVAWRREHLGPEHPQTIDAMSNLALCMLNQGEAEHVLELLRELVDLNERTRGPTHPRTLRAVNNLAGALWRLNRLDEVEPLLRGQLPTLEADLGPEHPLTVTFKHNLGTLLLRAGELDESVELLRAASDARRALYGVEHWETGASLRRLADAFIAAGRYGEAAAALEEVVTGWTAVLGADHASTLDARLVWAETLLESGERVEAVRVAGAIPRDAEAAAAIEGRLEALDLRLGTDGDGG
ncbi:MAG: serine/threonine-protein kinase [Phycisphaerales bacterium]